MLRILCVVIFCVLAAPVQAQFYDNWNGPSSPGYDEPYVPPMGWASEPQPSADALLQQYLTPTPQEQWAAEANRETLDRMRDNRCSGNWGVQTWNECD